MKRKFYSGDHQLSFDFSTNTNVTTNSALVIDFCSSSSVQAKRNLKRKNRIQKAYDSLLKEANELSW